MTRKRVLLTVILIFILVGSGSMYWLNQRYFSISYEPGDYTPVNVTLNNPYQGWYHIYGYVLSEEGSVPAEDIEKICLEKDFNQLVLLQINLRNYQNQELSPAALSQLEELLSAWERNGRQLVLRFLYDWNGKADETEPDNIEVIKRHMEQTAEVVNRHTASVYLMQGIYVGNYGEMNSSSYMSEEYMFELFNHLASLTENSIYLSVRTPAHWRAINQTYEPLSADSAFLGSNASRLGLFNDGMLGSGNDLGTYGDTTLASGEDFSAKGTREEELEFQHKLCQYVPNGGEVVQDNTYNDFENALAALSLMHVSYLNCDYDEAVLEKWKKATYQGEDCFYGMNGYDYIGEHLGYRYSITGSACSFDTWKDEAADLTLSIENSGFSNSYRRFDALITVENQDSDIVCQLPVDTDNRYWNTNAVTNLSIPLAVRNYGENHYHIYFSLTDSATGKQIAFANSLPASEYGYLIGELTVTK